MRRVGVSALGAEKDGGVRRTVALRGQTEVSGPVVEEVRG